ncbi:MAG: hypothetical protein XE06_0983 [Anaerolineaceae bacterium 46_22]|nr:MAG: hypothetical protein XE06_0983 [Anaerolineaceae bacterium 46_22]
MRVGVPVGWLVGVQGFCEGRVFCLGRGNETIIVPGPDFLTDVCDLWNQDNQQKQEDDRQAHQPDLCVK